MKSTKIITKALLGAMLVSMVPVAPAKAVNKTQLAISATAAVAVVIALVFWSRRAAVAAPVVVEAPVAVDADAEAIAAISRGLKAAVRSSLTALTDAPEHAVQWGQVAGEAQRGPDALDRRALRDAVQGLLIRANVNNTWLNRVLTELADAARNAATTESQLRGMIENIKARLA